MKYFIGSKLIKARPMTLGEYNLHKKWEIPTGEDPHRKGYLVEYSDGYQSWSPKDVFEQSYLEINAKDSITQEMVTAFVASTFVTKVGSKTTVVQCTLVNGFIITESSSCVDPKNYDEAIGKQLCMNKINMKIWEFLGFLLQAAVNGIKPAFDNDIPQVSGAEAVAGAVVGGNGSGGVQ